jgi:uncharacterized membrane protein YdjX (TVP38/TMEM64 family)
MKMKSVQRLIPLLLLSTLFLLFFYFRLDRYLNFNFLHEQRTTLLAWTKEHYFLAPLIFCGIYIVTIAIAIPAALLLTVTGGFLFGVSLGSVYVIISATIGACLLFFAVKMALFERLNHKGNKWIAKMQRGFQQNAFFYLLGLRLIPIFPFFIINIVAGALNIRTKLFVFATLLGGIPCTLIYTMMGNSLGRIFDKSENPGLNIILTPALFLPLLALACLCLLPVFYNRLIVKKAKLYEEIQ